MSDYCEDECEDEEDEMLAAEVAQLQNEAECYRLAKQIYMELLKLDSLLAKKVRVNAI